MKGKIQKFGNSLGVILPKRLIEELHLKEGDKVSIENKGSSLVLRPVDPEFEEWTNAYKQLNTSYKDVLRDLAE